MRYVIVAAIGTVVAGVFAAARWADRQPTWGDQHPHRDGDA